MKTREKYWKDHLNFFRGHYMSRYSKKIINGEYILFCYCKVCGMKFWLRLSDYKPDGMAYKFDCQKPLFEEL